MRDDDSALSDPAAGLTRAINRMCVTAGVTGHRAVHPPGDLCVRGGGFDDQFRSFFVAGKQFRCVTVALHSARLGLAPLHGRHPNKRASCVCEQCLSLRWHDLTGLRVAAVVGAGSQRSSRRPSRAPRRTISSPESRSR